jgi:hypothetical protein
MIAVPVALLVAGLLVLFVASSRGVQAAGLIVALVMGAILVAGGLSDALRGGYLRFMSFGRLPNAVAGVPEETPEPDPEYIAEAPDAADSAWERERAHYREKEQQERRGRP